MVEFLSHHHELGKSELDICSYTIADILKSLQELDQFDNSVPEVPVYDPNVKSDGTPDHDFKVRKNWWFSLVQNLELISDDAKTKGYLLPNQIEDIDKFIAKYTHHDFVRYTETPDIIDANNMIDSVVFWLESGINTGIIKT